MFTISIMNNVSQNFDNVETCPDLDAALKAAKTRRTTGNRLVQITGTNVKIVWARTAMKDRNHWRRAYG